MDPSTPQELLQAIRQTTREAREKSGEATIATRERIKLVSRLAQQHARQGQRDMSGEASRAARQISVEVDLQNHLFGKFQDRVDQRCGAQQALTQEVWEQCQGIISAGERIAEVATASGLLVLNATVNAGQLGARGAGMAVVSGEMRRLSTEVQEVNKDIQDLAREMLEIIPELQSEEREIRQSAGQLSASLLETSEQVRHCTDELLQELRGSGDSDQRLHEMLGCSARALARLEFQKELTALLHEVDDLAEGLREAG